jgi:hypothetical protein
MTYQCGFGSKVGLTPREPRFVCDGCGATRLVDNKASVAPTWFLDGRPPPGWRSLRVHAGSTRWDLCKRCWSAPDRKTESEMDSSVKQDMNTSKADAYLAQAKEIAADVDTWPDWKKAGFSRKNTP